MTETDHERRRYFRVWDRLGVAYRLVSADGADEATLSPQEAELQQIERTLKEQLEIVREKSPRLADILQLLNRKIDLKLRGAPVEDDIWHERIVEGSLSACGLAFPTEHPVPVHANMELRLKLLPDDSLHYIVANVVACDAREADDEQGQWTVRVDFTEISEHEQERLVQHVLRCQSRMLKSRRDVDEPSDD